MNIETDNAFSALSSDESEEVISTSSHQHGQPAVATIPPISRSVTMREEQEQLEAEYTAMQERMQQMRLASLQQRNDAMRAELDAAERQAAAMSSSSLYHSTPITAVHQPAPQSIVISSQVLDMPLLSTHLSLLPLWLRDNRSLASLPSYLLLIHLFTFLQLLQLLQYTSSTLLLSSSLVIKMPRMLMWNNG